MLEDSLFSAPSPSFVICRIFNEGDGSDLFFFFFDVNSNSTARIYLYVCMFLPSNSWSFQSVLLISPQIWSIFYFFNQKLSSISPFSFVHLYKDLECLFFIYLLCLSSPYFSLSIPLCYTLDRLPWTDLLEK